MSVEAIRFDVDRGARFVSFEYCISTIVLTFRESSDVFLIRPGESAVVKGIRYVLLTLDPGLVGHSVGTHLHCAMLAHQSWRRK